MFEFIDVKLLIINCIKTKSALLNNVSGNASGSFFDIQIFKIQFKVLVKRGDRITFTSRAPHPIVFAYYFVS